jgi:putative peptidoglycan lipid II flippase
MACNTVLLRGLYARSMARSAVIVTLTSVITNLLLSLILMQFLSYRGLALANSIAFTTSAFAGWIILLRLLGSNFRVFSASWVLKLSVSLFVMAAGIWAVRSILPFDPLAALYWRVLWLLVIIVIAVIIFYVSSRYFRFSEWDWIRSALKRKGK